MTLLNYNSKRRGRGPRPADGLTLGSQHVFAVIVLGAELAVIIDGAEAPLDGQSARLGHLQDAEVGQQADEGGGSYPRRWPR